MDTSGKNLIVTLLILALSGVGCTSPASYVPDQEAGFTPTTEWVDTGKVDLDDAIVNVQIVGWLKDGPESVDVVLHDINFLGANNRTISTPKMESVPLHVERLPEDSEEIGRTYASLPSVTLNSGEVRSAILELSLNGGDQNSYEVSLHDLQTVRDRQSWLTIDVGLDQRRSGEIGFSPRVSSSGVTTSLQLVELKNAFGEQTAVLIDLASYLVVAEVVDVRETTATTSFGEIWPATEYDLQIREHLKSGPSPNKVTVLQFGTSDWLASDEVRLSIGATYLLALEPHLNDERYSIIGEGLSAIPQ